MKNECGKTVDRENAYEVWQSVDGQWTWYVLKKYQSPEKEKENQYARWFCDVSSPFVDSEMGDVYVSEIKANAIRIADNVVNIAKEMEDDGEIEAFRQGKV